MDGKKLTAFGGNILVMDTAKSEETRGQVINANDIKAGMQEKCLIGQVMSTSDQLMEDGKWWHPPVEVGEHVVYGVHAGAGCVWQHNDTKSSGLTEGYVYRIIKWTEVLAKYNA